MKKLLILFLSIAVFLPSCKDDDDVLNDSNVLQYDGDNQSAPVFNQGTSVAAAYFPASYVATRSGKKIKDIEFFIRDVPAKTIVRVEKNGANNVPDEVLYELDVTGNVQGSNWNRIEFSNSADYIEIPSEGVWLTVEVQHDNADERSVGCDNGPADTNGDWIYSDTDSQWKSYRERTNNAVDINWNIRANLTD